MFAAADALLKLVIDCELQLQPRVTVAVHGRHGRDLDARLFGLVMVVVVLAVTGRLVMMAVVMVRR